MEEKSKDLGIPTDKVEMTKHPIKKAKERASHYQTDVKVKRFIRKGGHYGS